MSKSPVIISNVSQSAEPLLMQLQSQIKDLQEHVEQIDGVLQYLTMANFELNRDMQIIYTSLQDIAVSISDPSDSLGFSLNDEPDDDLIN